MACIERGISVTNRRIRPRARHRAHGLRGLLDQADHTLLVSLAVLFNQHHNNIPDQSNQIFQVLNTGMMLANIRCDPLFMTIVFTDVQAGSLCGQMARKPRKA